jgi:D-glycero-alpha-D-manno-heptose-7-phosphate kinase
MRFCQNGDIVVEPLGLQASQYRQLNRCLLLFYTNITRKAESVLTEQVNKMEVNLTVLRELKRLALSAGECLRTEAFDDFGHLLDQSWQLKKQLASGISNGAIDEIYATARKAGALGGKIAGAGAGGFLLLYCLPEKQEDVRRALGTLRELPFALERDGTKVIFNYRR